DAAGVLQLLQQVLEALLRDVEHDIAVHLDEAAVAVPGEARIVGGFGQGLDGGVIEAKVEDGVHHARHRELGAGANGEQKRLFDITEAAVEGDFHVCQFDQYLLEKTIGQLGSTSVVSPAGLGGDGEAGRNADAAGGHLGQACAFAAEEGAHGFSLAGTEVAMGGASEGLIGFGEEEDGVFGVEGGGSGRSDIGCCFDWGLMHGMLRILTSMNPSRFPSPLLLSRKHPDHKL
ncbi:MAG: hypothetical protein QG574_2318, partial [Cyanobacteriota bacterium erpe_2018_sw_21hr_WHONDRS-SW48-000092_B_bin.40]|nr:hypothetical protein [Cyanobacteriota bacterium erpe_2018_sw_21hr_WHONDRS-SW48-000092_B_bin.40]